MSILFTLAIFFYSSLSLAETLKVETFNIGMAHTYVPLAKERFPHIIDELKKSSSDIICLQEVWERQDRLSILDALSREYPHSLYNSIKQTRTSSRPACMPWDLFGRGKFVTCLLKKCSKTGGGDAQTACVINKCGKPLKELKEDKRECAASLMAQVGKSSISVMVELILNPMGAGLFAYKGSDGLLMLSKKPFANTEVLDFSNISTLNHRVALIGKTQSHHTVVCTHLTANMVNSAPYAGQFEGWEEENLKQVEKLLSKFEKSSGPTIIMGDFNCGQDMPQNNVEGDFANNCKLFLEAGFHDYLYETKRECTFCNDNYLKNKEDKASQLDHIFVRNASTIETRVIYKRPILVRQLGQGGVKTIPTNLSDHYGIEAVISK